MSSSNKKRKITAVLVDRANYARMKPILTELNRCPEVDLSLICAGTMLLERFGSAVEDVEGEGFKVTSRLYLELEGAIPLTMAKSIGNSIHEFSREFHLNRPDVVLLIGDRYETLGAAIAAAYLNLCIAHVQGGEVSGSIDESARHAITKFSHFHFPSTDRSADFIVRMGENPAHVYNFGCPSGDLIRGRDLRAKDEDINHHGVGARVDLNHPYFVVLFHPVTTEYGQELEQVQALYQAVRSQKTPTVWLWPNADAGSDTVSKFLRIQRETSDADQWARFIKHIEPSVFLGLMAQAQCLVGNSSSFVRDASFLGTPVVLVGDRQKGREMAENVLPVPTIEKSISAAIQSQCKHGRYTPSLLYGDGDAARKIVKKLLEINPYVQKRLSYPEVSATRSAHASLHSPSSESSPRT